MAETENWSKLKSTLGKNESGFYAAPVDNAVSQLQETLLLAESIRNQNTFTDCLIVGSPSDSLAVKTLLAIFSSLKSSSIKFHFLSSADPLFSEKTISSLHRNSTLVCMLMKTGQTCEMNALLVLLLEWMGKERVKTNFVFILNTTDSDLKVFASENGIPILNIHQTLSLSQTVFSPIAMFPAALAGFSVDSFFQGANTVRQYMEKTHTEKNAILHVANLLLKSLEKRKLHLLLPYSTVLGPLNRWFSLLWTESFQDNVSGVAAMTGSAIEDNLDLIRLLEIAPADKIAYVITVDQTKSRVSLSQSILNIDLSKAKTFSILRRRKLDDVYSASISAGLTAISKNGVPFVGFQFDDLDEGSLGSLFFIFCMIASSTAELVNTTRSYATWIDDMNKIAWETLARQPIPDHPDSDQSALARLRRGEE